jgi:hypothetical protein
MHLHQYKIGLQYCGLSTRRDTQLANSRGKYYLKAMPYITQQPPSWYTIILAEVQKNYLDMR